MLVLQLLCYTFLVRVKLWLYIAGKGILYDPTSYILWVLTAFVSKASLRINETNVICVDMPSFWKLSHNYVLR